MDQSAKIVLIGDVGGTNVRLQVFKIDGTSLDYDSNTPIKTGKYNTSKFSTFLEFVQEFLNDLGPSNHPNFAVIGKTSIAGAVHQNKTVLANTTWPETDGTDIGIRLNIKPFILLNDFHSLSYGVLGLQDTFLLPLVHGAPDDGNSLKVVTGPGTGLGVAFLMPLGGNQYRVWPTEGGHKYLSSSNLYELQYHKYLTEQLKTERIQLEQAMAGPGIPYIYNFIKKINPEATPLLEEELQGYSFDLSDPKKFPSPEVLQRGIKGDDILCAKTLELFCEIYETALGDIMTTSLPFGGIYLFGGLTVSLARYLQKRQENGEFMKAYKDDRKFFAHVFERVPIYIIIKEELGLEGAYQSAFRLMQRGLDVQKI